MPDKVLYKEIQQTIDSIQSQLKMIKEQEHIPEIEIDLLLNDVRNLYTFIKNIERDLKTSGTATVESSVKIAASEKENKITEIKNENGHDQISEKTGINRKQGTTLAETFPMESSLHHKISKNPDSKSIAEQLEKTPIVDLKSSIGLNEKFLFINKLYQGHSEEFEKDLNFINSCENHDQALSYLRENSWKKQHWTKENEVLGAFLNLVERKFL